MSKNLSTHYLTTRELAALLRIKERKVYELAAAGDVPCSRATGKLLFPRHAIEAWIARSSSGPGLNRPTTRPQIFAGSHDPLLEWALRESGAGLASFFDGSLDGVARFASGDAAAAGLHLYDPEQELWNVPLVAERFGFEPIVLVQFAWRERGLIVTPDRVREFSGIGNLRGKQVVGRQPEAGSQTLLEHLLAAEKLDLSELTFALVARSETDAAQAIADGKADAAFGLLGAARQFRLGFVPVIRERFDLLVDRAAWFEPPLQRLFSFCASKTFADKAEEVGGYDVTGFGQVQFNGQ